VKLLCCYVASLLAAPSRMLALDNSPQSMAMRPGGKPLGLIGCGNIGSQPSMVLKRWACRPCPLILLIDFVLEIPSSQKVRRSS
jgi:hypothetical protein